MKSTGRPLKLSRIADVLETSLGTQDDVTCRSLSTDSRFLEPGAVFFAVHGHEQDGSLYIDDAIRKGAVAIVTESAPKERVSVPVLEVANVRRAKAHIAAEYYGHASLDLNVVGITGTNGKTSTAYMLEALFEHDGRRSGLLGTIGYDTGNGRFPAPNTTPDALDLQRYFAEMVDRGCTNAVMEVSSHALSQDRVEAVEFDVGVFTNLSLEHLDYHRTMEAYRDAKSLLFERLSPAAIAVFNADDPVTPILRERCGARVLTYGIQKNTCDVRAELRRIDIDGMSFDLHSPWGSIDITSRFVGRHNLSNILAAATAALASGVPLSSIKGAFEALTTVPGRLEPVDRGQDYRVLVDYAHTHQALRHVLETLRPLTKGRLVVVFGCGGDRDRTKRPLMGEVVSQLADLAVVTSDNPRGEDPEVILSEIESGMNGNAEVQRVVDRRAAIDLALRQARGGDIVLIAGKGHENCQIVGTEKIAFNDREVAEDILWSLQQ